MRSNMVLVRTRREPAFSIKRCSAAPHNSTLGVEDRMSRSLKVVVLLFAAFVCALLSHALYATPVTDRCFDAGGALHAVSGISVAGTFAPRISIARSALRELRERMARYAYPTGICIMGPLEEDSRAPDSVEEAWLLEKLYGPPQRWILSIVPLEEFAEPSVDPGETLHVEQIFGVTVGVRTSKTVSHLSVELRGDAIRVYEVDA